MINRHLKDNILTALSDTRAVVIQGPRQCGKTTLIKDLSKHGYQSSYFTLDDFTTLSLIKSDPAGFINNTSGAIIVDEVQRAPELLLAIKSYIDIHQDAGKFLLSGSTNILSLKKLADSLAGRMEILTLWPLSEGEKNQVKKSFIDDAFDKIYENEEYPEFNKSVLPEGGFPEVILRKKDDRRQAWFSSYLTSILHKDIRELANIEGLTEFPKLISVLATRAGNLLNISEVSRTTGIASTTLKRYLSLLEATFMLRFIYPWYANIGKRFVKSPKVFFCDLGILCHLMGINGENLNKENIYSGAIIENFVAMELTKQITWSKRKPKIFHYRTQDQKEIDFILEDLSGEVVAIEVKSSTNPSSSDFRNLKQLKIDLGNKFKKGILFYSGTKTLSIDNNIFCYPITSLFN